MKQDDTKALAVFFILLCVPVIWVSLLIAPFLEDGLMSVLENLNRIFEKPFSIKLCEDSLKTVLIFLCLYAFGIGIYYSTRKNYRHREEHGSVKWGRAEQVDKKYRKKEPEENKLLTQHVRIGLDGRKHRRNLNVLVCGGSGAEKTRFYCKPNIMQANTSFVILDPKGLQLSGQEKVLYYSSHIK